MKEYYFGVIEYCKNNNLMEYIDILNDFYTCIYLGRVNETDITKIINDNQKFIELYNIQKKEIEILDNRIDKAINILELSSQNKGICTRPETDTIQSALLILKGSDKE